MVLYQFFTKLMVGLLIVVMVSGFPMKDALVNSYYKSMKNTRRNSKTTIVRLYTKGLSSFVRITATSIDARKTNQESDPDTLIELESLGPRRVLIKSATHNSTYVCFAKNSDVKIMKSFIGTECVFIKQNNRNNYVTFQSAYNNTWYLGFSQRKINFGLPKSGRKTTSKQRSIQFVERTPS